VEADPSLASLCDLALGNRDKADLPARLLGLGPGEAPPALPSRFQERSRATLKVQDGCQGGCTYCIVPRLRGRSRSVPPEAVLTELERLSGLGFSEAVLCGVHLGHYGADLSQPTTLAALLEAITQTIERRGLSLRVRLSSLEPQEALEVVPLMAASPAVCRHLHISLQSGSDSVLARMRRHYLAWRLRGLALAATARIPGLAVGCDVIAGFPGETAEEHAETLELLSPLPLSYLHVFPYSARPGTAAAAMPEQVAAPEKAKRAAALRLLSARMRKAFYQAQVGGTAFAVLQGRDRATRLPKGLTDNYMPVLIDLGDKRLPEGVEAGRGLVRVRIDRVVDSRVIATLI
jgi:threonylcarbamoyladenosine tRNA methylthiotransferase MtaB